MMTQTLLSAATCASPKAQRVYSAPQRRLGADSIIASDARRVQWHRHSCLCAVAKPITQQIAEATLSLPSKILIANPRLTLRVSPIRICKLKISNRKFPAISHRTLPGSDPLSAVTSHRTSNRDTAIRNRNKPYPFSPFQFSNRDKNSLFPDSNSKNQNTMRARRRVRNETQ
jgi:hypothetical protein